MGLITTLINANQQKKTADLNKHLQANDTLLKLSTLAGTPEGKEQIYSMGLDPDQVAGAGHTAVQNIMDLYDKNAPKEHKGASGIFRSMLGGLAGLNPMPSDQFKNQQMPQFQTQAHTPEQVTQYHNDRIQNQANILARQKSVADAQALQDELKKKQALYEDDMNRINTNPEMTDAQKAEARLAAFNVHHREGDQRARESKWVHVKGPDGQVVRALYNEDQQPGQQLKLINGTVLDPKQYTAIDDPKEQTPTESSINDKRSIDAYREKYKIPEDQKLTASQELTALGEGADARMSPSARRARDIAAQIGAQNLADKNEKNGPPKPVLDDTPEYRIAQKLAYGQLTMQDFSKLYSYSRDVNKKTSIFDKASELNPQFNPAAFEAGYALFKNPKVGQQLASMDNVKRGVDDLLRFSDDASRTGVPLLNKAVIKGGINLGGKNYSNFAAARIGFADELSGALGFGGATDMSKEMGLDLTNPNLSPKAFKESIQKVVIPFIDRKRQSLLHQMGPYGAPGMNPAAEPGDNGSAAPTVALPKPSKPGARISVDQATAYVKANDGDKDKARKAATAAGFTF